MARALKTVRNGAGKLYDPNIVDVLVRIVETGDKDMWTVLQS